MDKEFFQGIFSQQMGFVYKYLGTVPEGEQKSAYITGKFAEAAGSHLVSTMVCELNNYGVTVVYNHSNTDDVNHEHFELLMDLVPYPRPESFVLPETPSSDEPGEQTSQG
jgi:hypothetical protein